MVFNNGYMYFFLDTTHFFCVVDCLSLPLLLKNVHLFLLPVQVRPHKYQFSVVLRNVFSSSVVTELCFLYLISMEEHKLTSNNPVIRAAFGSVLVLIHRVVTVLLSKYTKIGKCDRCVLPLIFCFL